MTLDRREGLETIIPRHYDSSEGAGDTIFSILTERSGRSNFEHYEPSLFLDLTLVLRQHVQPHVQPRPNSNLSRTNKDVYCTLSSSASSQ